MANSCDNCEYFVKGIPGACNAFQVIPEDVFALTSCAEYQLKNEEGFNQRQQELQQKVTRESATGFNDLPVPVFQGENWMEEARKFWDSNPAIELTPEQVNRMNLDRIRRSRSDEYAYMENGRVYRLRPRNHSYTGHEAEEYMNQIELQKEYIRCRFDVTPALVLLGHRIITVTYRYIRERYSSTVNIPAELIEAVTGLKPVKFDPNPHHIEVVAPIGQLMR